MTDAINIEKKGLPHDPRISELSGWIEREGLLSRSNSSFLTAYCKKLVGLGVPLMRFHVTLQALHPVYGGVGFNWNHVDGPERQEYAHAEEAPDTWRKSPFNYMISNALQRYRERICDSDAPSRFGLLNEMKAQGATDYFAVAVLFEEWEEDRPITLEDRLEGTLMSWMTHAPGGFAESDLSLISETIPALCLAIKSGTARQTAQDLLEVYLGRDAGQRVLSGEIQRGSSQWIDAVICYFDLEGFTNLSQQIEGEDLLALLNDYFGVVVGHIHSRGGNVLKFMGDGLLAIFDRDQFSDAAHRAIETTRALGHDMSERNRARKADGLPTLGWTLALHAGRVLYGNMGGETRLDFTVIGPEVNLAARISGMHRPLGQRIIVSEAVARDADDPNINLVSLGRYMLRGVDEPKELFTIYDRGN